jgi:hypothetical protein
MTHFTNIQEMRPLWEGNKYAKIKGMLNYCSLGSAVA